MRIEIESIEELKELIAMFSAPLPTGAEQAAAEVLRKTEAKLSVKKAVEDAIKQDKAQEEPKPKKQYKDDPTLRKKIQKMGVLA